MANIRITKGLDIPMKGLPEGEIRPFKEIGNRSAGPSQISLDLKSFDDVTFKILVKAGDVVKIGQPLAEDKKRPGCMFVSPAGGVVREVRRGLKRRLLDIVIDTAQQEEFLELGTLSPDASKEEILKRLKEGGAFSRIHARPFSLLADPEKTPRAIFVKAIESAPMVPPAEMQVEGHEKEFQAGLTALSKLTPGPVHLVYREDSHSKAFTQAQGVVKHTAQGPHPIGTHSLHIQRIDPIRNPDDLVWVLNVQDVVMIGHLLLAGKYLVDRVIGLGGEGILPEHVGYYRVREGFPVQALIDGRLPKGHMRFVSGDPLMGHKIESDEFLGFNHYAFCVIPENSSREFLHFFRLGSDKYSFSKAYLSGHLNNKEREYHFTTNQHGEHRAFIDPTLYEKVQPLQIPTMLLVKAVMAEDFDLAQTLGLLEVDPEDFALATFVCPSKMEMTEIMKNGIKQYAKEILQ